jgi:septal ring factor EnvC (AmiA/AmiB activator)
VDPLVLGALATIAVGVITGAVAAYGHRGQRATAHTGVLITGYDGLVNQVQKERDKAERDLAEKERELAAAYTELASERAERARLLAQIAELTTERQRLIDRISALGGTAS